MNRAIAVAVVVVLLSIGCRDPSTDKVHEKLTVPQGGSFSGRTESDDSYSVPLDYDLDSRLEDLPDGFHFRIDDEYFDGGHLVVEYTLFIEPWVPPDTYRFVLNYRIREHSPEDDLFDDLLEIPEEIEFKFKIVVSPQPAGNPPQAVVVKGLSVENPDQRTTLIILE